MSGRREEVDAVEVGEACESGGIGISGEPLTRVAALKLGSGEWRAAEEIACEGLFTGAVFAFNGGDLEMRRGHFGLHQ